MQSVKILKMNRYSKINIRNYRVSKLKDASLTRKDNLMNF